MASHPDAQEYEPASQKKPDGDCPSGIKMRTRRFYQFKEVMSAC